MAIEAFLQNEVETANKKMMQIDHFLAENLVEFEDVRQGLYNLRKKAATDRISAQRLLATIRYESVDPIFSTLIPI